MKRLSVLSIAALGVLLLPVHALALLITATDPQSQFDVGNGVYSTPFGGEATGLQPLSIQATHLHLEIQLVDPPGETPFTILTEFSGTDDAADDITIWDGENLLLGLVVSQNLVVTNIATGAQSLTIGQIGTPTSGEVRITGGTLANDFGGVDATGTIELLVNDPSHTIAFGNSFGTTFTAQTNIQIELQEVPEPGTALLLSTGLLGLLWWERRAFRLG
jgi:hypothetical protein